MKIVCDWLYRQRKRREQYDRWKAARPQRDYKNRHADIANARERARNVRRWGQRPARGLSLWYQKENIRLAEETPRVLKLILAKPTRRNDRDRRDRR